MTQEQWDALKPGDVVHWHSDPTRRPHRVMCAGDMPNSWVIVGYGLSRRADFWAVSEDPKPRPEFRGAVNFMTGVLAAATHRAKINRATRLQRYERGGMTDEESKAWTEAVRARVKALPPPGPVVHCASEED